jgi:hypothetical protein
LPIALALAVAPPKAPPKTPPKTAPATAPATPPPASAVIAPPVVAAPAPEPAPPAAAAAQDAPPAPAPLATTTAALPPSPVATTTIRALAPWDLALQIGLDVPGAPRLPMASTRLDLGLQFALPASTFGSVGLRTGYSYVAGDIAVVDPVLGVDEHALLMAHRVPVRLVGRAGLRGDNALAIGLVASGGVDVAFVQAQSFGRVASTSSLVPGASVGAFVTRAFGDAMDIGLSGEWDTAAVDLAASTPGLSGDLAALRLTLDLHFIFG